MITDHIKNKFSHNLAFSEEKNIKCHFARKSTYSVLPDLVFKHKFGVFENVFGGKNFGAMYCLVFFQSTAYLLFGGVSK